MNQSFSTGNPRGYQSNLTILMVCIVNLKKKNWVIQYKIEVYLVTLTNTCRYTLNVSKKNQYVFVSVPLYLKNEIFQLLCLTTRQRLISLRKRNKYVQHNEFESLALRSSSSSSLASAEKKREVSITSIHSLLSCFHIRTPTHTLQALLALIFR